MSTITRESVTHNLKIWPEYYAAVCAGDKRAELRWNDRNYQAGDILDLCEWDPNEEAFTGEFTSVTVTHVAELGQWMPGYVLLSFALVSQEAEAEPVAFRSKLKPPAAIGSERWDYTDHRQPDAFEIENCVIERLFNAPSAPVAMKDHQIRELVNELRDIAVEYHGTQQLRERIARTVRAAMLQSFGNSEQLNSPVIPDGLRLALSNAGIAAPESDELLFATHEKYIQMLVTWVKDRKPFQTLPAAPQQEA